MLAALLDGVRRGTKECRRRFRNDRWNCQALTETAGGRRLDFGHVLVKGQSGGLQLGTEDGDWSWKLELGLVLALKLGMGLELELNLEFGNGAEERSWGLEIDWS